MKKNADRSDSRGNMFIAVWTCFRKKTVTLCHSSFDCRYPQNIQVELGKQCGCNRKIWGKSISHTTRGVERCTYEVRYDRALRLVSLMNWLIAELNPPGSTLCTQEHAQDRVLRCYRTFKAGLTIGKTMLRRRRFEEVWDGAVVNGNTP